jgi:hypothetical protein
MKGLIVLSLLFLLGVQVEQMTMGKLIYKVSESKGIKVSLLEGEFNYYSSNEKTGVYKSAFVGDKKYGVINYISNAGAGTLDSLCVGGQKLAIDKKYDARSIKVFSLKFNKCQYICFMGKSVSASGSGVQVTYYTLVETNKSKEIIGSKSFESRFGIIQNIGDHNKDGKLDYMKVIHGDESGQFLSRLYDLASGESVGDNFISLKYLGNDNFEIIGCNWFKPIGCE